MIEPEIRHMRPEDVDSVVELFERVYYVEDPTEAVRHFADHSDGGGESFLAYVGTEFAGFITIRWLSENPRFKEANIPLIHHLCVFSQYQRRGIASKLMDAAEALIATRATRAGITVGIFDKYGQAQRLYARRGYIPDGRGVCQSHRPLKYGDRVTVDDDLIMWLTKDLTNSAAATSTST